MQKISIEVLEKMLRAELTGAEVDMLLYIARYQNNKGISGGIYYKEVCEATGMSYQAFYDCKKGLEKKGIIHAEKNNYYDWNITILDNSFAGKENFGRGYVSVSSDMVKSCEFRGFRANTKLMALYLLREWQISRKHTGSFSYQILKENLIKKFKAFGVSARMIRSYLGELQPFLHVYLEKGKKYYLTFKQEFVKNRTNITENDERRHHELVTACRRNRIKEPEPQECVDILTLMKQYWVKIEKNLSFDLSEIVKKSIEIRNERIKNRNRWSRSLNPSLVHKLLKEELGMVF